MAAIVSGNLSNPPVQPSQPSHPGCLQDESKITKISRFQLSAEQKIILQTICQIAVRIFYVFAFVLVAAIVLPIDAFFIPAIAVGASALTGFFYMNRKESPPPVFQRLPPLLPPLNKSEIEETPLLSEIIPSERPRGLYRSGMNCSFNALVHFLNSDPAAAKRLRNPLPLSGTDLPVFEDFLAPLHPPPRLIEDFRSYVAAQKPPRLKLAFKNFIDGYKPLPEDVSSIKKFVLLYNRFLSVVRPFSKFLAAYDRAVHENRSVVDKNCQAIRHALSQAHPSIDPSENIQQDVAEILKYILNSLPDEHLIGYEAATHYDTRNLPAIAELPDGIARREEKTWGFLLEILDSKEQTPQLEKMFQAHCRRNIENSRKEFTAVNGKTCFYRPEYEELLFTQAPPILRFQIRRFDDPSNGILNKIWSGWRTKIDTPIDVPSQLEIRLKNGTLQKYRLTSCVNHEGNSLSSGHFIVGRITNGQRYLIDDHSVSRVDQQTWEERILPHAYLLCYLPVP